MPITRARRRTLGRITGLLLVGGLTGGLIPGASAAAGPPAVLDVGKAVVNTKAKAGAHDDGRSRTDTAFEVRQFDTTRAQLSNAAAATTGDCTDCRAVALSFQVVLLDGPSLQLSASNLAQAVNTRCVRCESLAGAYQFVVATNRGLRLSADAQRQLESVERQLAALRDSDAPLPQIQAEVDALASRVVDVLVTALKTSSAPQPEAAPAAANPFKIAGLPVTSGLRSGVTTSRHLDVRRAGHKLGVERRSD